MNISKRALLISTGIHLLYIVATFGIGFIRTLNYEPDIIAEADKVVVLQDEVVIVTAGSPLVYVFTWIGLTFVLVLGLHMIQRIRQPNRT